MTTTMKPPIRETNARKPAETKTVQQWINECIELCQPNLVHV